MHFCAQKGIRDVDAGHSSDCSGWGEATAGAGPGGWLIENSTLYLTVLDALTGDSPEFRPACLDCIYWRAHTRPQRGEHSLNLQVGCALFIRRNSGCGASGEREDKDVAMYGMGTAERLSGLDASFLYLERKEIPLHMAGVFLFDGPLPFDDFVRRMDSQLHLIPRYRQVVCAPPYNVGYPVWRDDPEFDIGRHIFPVHLEAPGGRAELEDLTGRTLSTLMDRSKPLWDLRVVDGLKDGRGALIVRIHHSLADGIAGAALVLKVMLSATPETSWAGRKPRVRMPPKPASEPSLVAAIASAIGSSLGHLIDAGTGAVSIGQTLLRDRKTLSESSAVLAELAGSVERLPFNKRRSGDRQFCWTEVELADVQAVRAAAGGSVNDVVLTVLTRALAHYVQAHGETVDHRMMRIVCPVSLRQDNGESLGNRLSFLVVALPLDVANPVSLLQTVAVRTATMKKVRAADALSVVANCFGIAPPAVQAMLWRGISEVTLPLPLFNMICTNIPGSPEPLYCVGRRLLTWYPQVPTGYDLGINCAVTSYCGKLSFGLIADTQAAPDVKRLRDFLKVSSTNCATRRVCACSASPGRGGRSLGRRRKPAATRRSCYNKVRF